MVKFPFKKYQLVQQAKLWGYLFSFQSKMTSTISVKGMPPRSGASRSLPRARSPGSGGVRVGPETVFVTSFPWCPGYTE